MGIKKHFLASVAALTLLGAGGGPPPDPETPTNIFYNDLLPLYSPVAAWGLRQMLESYTGPIIRVRDTTGDAEQDVYADDAGNLEAFTVTGTAAVKTIYDQTGNGAHLTQATTTKQAILNLTGAGSGGPCLVFDGVDDFYQDVTTGTTRPYMIATPVHISMSGARQPREQWGKTWAIPNNLVDNNSPYARLIFEQDSVSTLNWEAQVRVDSTQTSNMILFGMNNRKGWSGHALVPTLGKFLQQGSPETNVTTDATITYPNTTAFQLSANGVGLENNGMNWVEHIVVDGGASPTKADIQNAIDKISWKYLIGDNRFFRMYFSGSFATAQHDSGLADLEFHSTIGGTDLTDQYTPCVANKRYSGSESWEMAVDGSLTTWYSGGTSGGSGIYPTLYIMLDTNVPVVETKITARNDAYHEYTVKKFKLARWTATGWEEAPEVDNTAAGHTAGQVYKNFIDWPRPALVPQSAAYWRMRVAGADGDNVQLGELYFRDADGVDLCTGGTILKSSQYDAATPYFGAVNAFDRVNTTGWAASGFAGQWLGYQMTEAKVVTEFSFRASNSYPGLIPKSIVIDYSLDGTVWKPYYGWRDAASMVGAELRTKTLVPPDKAWASGKHRYWRVRPMGSKSGVICFTRLWFWTGSVGGTDAIVTAGGAAIESSHLSTWFNSFLWTRGSYSYGWQPATVVPGAEWVGWDFGAGNEQDVLGCSVAAYDVNSTPRGMFIEYSDDGVDWIVRDSFYYEWVSTYEVLALTFPT